MQECNRCGTWLADSSATEFRITTDEYTRYEILCDDCVSLYEEIVRLIKEKKL